MIPQQLHAALGNRERDLPQPFDAHAVIHQLGIQGVAHGAAAHVVGVTEIAVAGVDVHLVGGRVALEQRFLAFGQLVGVLRHVLRSDHQNRFFISVRVDRVVAGEFDVVPTGHLPQVLAGVGRDGPRGVTGLFGADTGQLLAQFGRFFGGHLGQCGTDRQSVDGQGGCEHDACSCYFHVLPPTRVKLAGGVVPFFAICSRTHRPLRLIRR